MLDIGFQELLVIGVIALLIFGPKKLPDLGRAMGRALREFRRATEEFRSTIETNLQIHVPDPGPSTEPAESEPSPSIAPPPEPLPAPANVEKVEEAPVPPGEPYWARRGARLFHRRECAWGKRIEETERVYFERVAEAKEQGHQTCPVCEPWEPD